MKITAIRLSVVALFVVSAVVLGQKATQGVVRVTSEQLKWVDEPDGLGFKTAIVEGDPKKPGLYIIQVKFPPFVMSKPHFHPETRYATVLKGTWWTGDGDVFDPSKTIPLKVGSYMKHPAGAHHFDGSKDEEVIIQLVGMGPSETTKMKPAEGLFASSKPK